MLLKQGYITPKLKSSLQKFYDRHHDLVDRYEISISQITMDLTVYVDCYLSSIAAKALTGLDCIYE